MRSRSRTRITRICLSTSPGRRPTGEDRFLKPCTSERTSDASVCKEITYVSGVLGNQSKTSIASFDLRTS